MKQILTCAICLCLQYAHAQTTGRIIGTVKDPSGAIVAGAVVECFLQRSGEERKVLTDAAGSYSALLLPAGDYQVVISAKGFATLTFNNITVAVTETPILNVELPVATDITAITVSGLARQTAGPQLGRVVDSRAVSELPLATRNFTQILGLSPGTATYLPDNTGLVLLCYK